MPARQPCGLYQFLASIPASHPLAWRDASAAGDGASRATASSATRGEGPARLIGNAWHSFFTPERGDIFAGVRTFATE